jgi:hypothetical protein
MDDKQNLIPIGPQRRRFLQGAAGAALGVGAMLTAGAAAAEVPAVGSQGLPGGGVDVSAAPYSAKGDGKHNDAPAIQAAIDAAAKAGRNGIGGGVVWLPPGLYQLGAGLVVPNQIVLAGAGWGPPYAPANGSTLYVTRTEFVPLTLHGRGATVRDLAIFHAQPPPAPGWRPNSYPAAIHIDADDVRLENIYLQNPTVGVTMLNAGRVTISRLWGQPLQTGISIDNAQDVIKIDNVHFWPFWHSDPPVMDYLKQNATAIASYRNDNPHFSNIFALGYSALFLFGSSQHGNTSKFRIVNADADICRAGIVLSGDGTTGQVTNFTCQGPGASGILASGNHVTLQSSNVRVTNYANSGIRAGGDGTVFSLENVWIENWDQSRQGVPAIEAASPTATILVGFGRIFTGSKSPETGGVGTIKLDT